MPFAVTAPPANSPPWSGGDVVGGELVDDATRLEDNADSTKTVSFELGGLAPGAAVVLVPPSAAGTYTLATGSSWDPSAVETLTNKTLGVTNTLTGATCASLTNASAAVITVPAGAGDRTLATLTGTETLTNKTLGVTNTLTGATAASVTNSSGAVITVPSGAGDRTLATLTGTETLTNKTLGATNTLTGATCASLTNASAAVITVPSGAGDRTIATLTGTETLTNKTISGATCANLTNVSGAVITIPTGAGARTLATLTGTETLTNKTLTLPSMSQITVGATTQTLPSGLDGTIINTTDAATFAIGAKTFENNLLRLRNSTNGASTTFNAPSQTVDRTCSLPNLPANDVVVCENVAQTLTNKTFDILSLQNGAFTATVAAPTLAFDVDFTLPVSASLTDTLVTEKSISTYSTGLKRYNEDFFALRNTAKTFVTRVNAGAQTSDNTFTFPVTASDTVVCAAATQTLTNKTLSGVTLTGTTLQDSTTTLQDDADPTKQLRFELSSITTGTTRTLTVPNLTNSTICVIAGAQTLTNKTLTTPVIASITNTVAQAVPNVVAGTLVNTTQAQTFATNVKTFNSGLLALRNPLNTFSVTLNAGAQIGDRTFTFPVTGSSTILVTEPPANSDIGSDAVRYRAVYLNGTVNYKSTAAFSTNYDLTAAEYLNSNDTASWVLGLRTDAAGTGRIAFRYNNTAAASRGFFSTTGPDTAVNFTMQHHLLLESPAENTLASVGLLYARVDGQVATFLSHTPSVVLTGKAGIIADDALPVMRRSTSRNQKNIYGAYTRPAPSEWFGSSTGLELDDVPDLASRGLFATQGEGALWVLAPEEEDVVNIAFFIEPGDFLSSFAHGYAGRQMSQVDIYLDDPDIHYSWSVARAGFSCTYDLASVGTTAYTCERIQLEGLWYRRAFIPVGFCM